MDKRLPEIAEQLLLIERELRALGWWDTTPPGEQALSSQEPFCVDSLEFEQWLQWIFLPRMKIILERDLPLPNASGIVEMAEMVYSGRRNEARLLQKHLARFDQLIVNAD
ncbi:YqcC family protein [Pseudomonas sp. CDFA 602]|uniref:YqcC family protein n=1 Tax=Pseudomonas californiensis TaxID=2829823 RepID=UPI001E431F8B|nr:YqcC family protein [Pseudomonas californiensis]MCD5996319.1 YqcC family protein [Pseudomonas californiensis]MCD6001918.1 YqcC family protein [Pseudomonas californiensis]